MGIQAVKVKRETIEACMKCPICNKLLDEATTISLCLHTFCRKCISEKLSDEGVDCCPVCNIHLGCVPEEKLRPDNNLQEIRGKIFPFKRRKTKAHQVLPPAPPQPKKKERLLSSLVVSTPKVSVRTGATGRRTESLPKRAFSSRNSTLLFEQLNNKTETSAEDMAVGSSPLDWPNKLKKRKESSSDDPSSEHKLWRGGDNGIGSTKRKFHPWNPLNCLAEAANRTKSSKQSSQLIGLAESTNRTKSSKLNRQGFSLARAEQPTGFTHSPEIRAKSEDPNIPEGGLLMPESKARDRAVRWKRQDDKNGTASVVGSGIMKHKRGRGAAAKKASASEVVCPSAQFILDASSGKWNTTNRPVWFSLVALEDKKGGDASLPQISARYLMTKDGSAPVSIIQKYIVSKLNLTDESEVEILYQGQPVVPTLRLDHLVDRTASASKSIMASVGTSAKDLIMVLSYCRKVQRP
ncbi:hypothetical protein SAY87_008504 [Trapa incisa]|uniref:RING-type domain-containing protein n=1 Tax=Trapa incisa TaxID=236973 RepID=A0AAN7JXD2_9MYRT|nr:hypothetical protein SAY87_008504 [Trapa incisa]